MKSKQIRRQVTANGYRAGAAIVTVVAFVGALGAPIKWD
jgi:hypothetical protein